MKRPNRFDLIKDVIFKLLIVKIIENLLGLDNLKLRLLIVDSYIKFEIVFACKTY